MHWIVAKLMPTKKNDVSMRQNLQKRTEEDPEFLLQSQVMA
jgi:hypothetical protein